MTSNLAQAHEAPPRRWSPWLLLPASWAWSSLAWASSTPAGEARAWGALLAAALALLGAVWLSVLFVRALRRRRADVSPLGQEVQDAATRHVAAKPDADLASDHLDTTIMGMECPRCHALYDVGARFCPTDAQPLVRVELDPSCYDFEEVEFRCPLCDARFHDGRGFCAHDGARLVPADDEVQVFVPVPVMLDAAGLGEVPPGLQRPDPGPTLIPVHGQRTCGLPVTGAGPRRKVCPSCGLQYPAGATHCGLDQSPLNPLH